MSFYSVNFLTFFLPVFLLHYLFSKNSHYQSLLLLMASYFFYGFADWRLLFLLVGTSLFNYLIGFAISQSKSSIFRKLLLITGTSANLLSLIVFRYLNFFIEGIRQALSQTFGNMHSGTIEMIVPLGISFYIFLSISYLVDVYKNQIPAEKNVINVLLSLSFFPIILAGPVQRPATIIPQFKKNRLFDFGLASDGIRQFFWGLFVKLVIADNCAVFVDKVFGNYSNLNASTLIFGGIFYSIQIYADFSAYSDMAIGIAKLLGIKLMRNFHNPYFARDINDFWKRWHISLTTWFRDYVFLPISYFLSGKIKSNRLLFVSTELWIYFVGILITWMLTGLWHGANMTFVTWGLIHAFFLIVFRIFFKARKKLLGKYHLFKDPLIIATERFFTLLIVMFAWIFFRAESNTSAIEYINGVFSISLFKLPDFFPVELIFPVSLFFIIEWHNRDQEYGLDFSNTNKPRFIRWAVYYFLVIIIFFYQVAPQDFIYFRF